MIAVTVFWLAVALVVYTYVLFPAVVLARGRLFPRAFVSADWTPTVSVVMAAHNEEAHIAERIENLLAQDYPGEKVQIVVASDGSEDRTVEIAGRYADRGVEVLDGPRRGKTQTVNVGVARAEGEVLVFTDANTHFRSDALRALVRPLADPEVGGVAGDQVYVRDAEASLSADGEMAYWSFDRMLKVAQSRAGSVTSATGAIYAIRRELYEPVPPYATDDFVVSTGVVARGARLVFAGDAVAVEPVAVSAGAEFGRKVRYITQGFYSVGVMRRLLDPRVHGFYAFQLGWHKILRRVMGLPLLAIAAVSPALWAEGELYRLLVLGEIVVLGLVAAGLLLHRWRPGCSKLASLVFYFFMVNAAALVALVRYARGDQVVTWTPSHDAEPERSGP